LQAVELPAAVEFAAAACLGIPATTTFQAIHMLGDITGKNRAGRWWVFRCGTLCHSVCRHGRRQGDREVAPIIRTVR
jgi:hypothetical protein